MKNYGLLLAPNRPTDWRFGGLSGVDNSVILAQDGQWDRWLPDFEAQSRPGFDSMSCVPFSALNGIEALAKRKGYTINRSDRFTAFMSGTTPEGNTFSAVSDSIRKDGTVDESSWPFSDLIRDWATYMTPPPDDVKAEGEQSLYSWKINSEFVWDTPDKLKEALQYAPVQVAIHAYGPLSGDVYGRTEEPGNHAVMLYGHEDGKYWKIYDHYVNKFKKLAWDTRFWGAMKYDLNMAIPSMPTYQFVEDTMYFVTDGHGEEFAFIAGKLRHDDPGKMSRQIAYRRDGDTRGRYKPITSYELAGVNAYDLKGNDLGPASKLA
jgi:hypothetical protein